VLNAEIMPFPESQSLRLDPRLRYPSSSSSSSATPADCRPSSSAAAHHEQPSQQERGREEDEHRDDKNRPDNVNAPFAHYDIGGVDFGESAPENDWMGRNVYVRNLPPLSALTMEMPNEVHIYHMFARFGKIERVKVVRDTITQQPVGIAMVLFASPESARNAIHAINNAIFGAFATMWVPKSLRYSGGATIGDQSGGSSGETGGSGGGEPL
jgi:RNA recognition motif-containing protein